MWLRIDGIQANTDILKYTQKVTLNFPSNKPPHLRLSSALTSMTVKSRDPDMFIYTLKSTGTGKIPQQIFAAKIPGWQWPYLHSS